MCIPRLINSLLMVAEVVSDFSQLQIVSEYFGDISLIAWATTICVWRKDYNVKGNELLIFIAVGDCD